MIDIEIFYILEMLFKLYKCLKIHNVFIRCNNISNKLVLQMIDNLFIKERL